MSFARDRFALLPLGATRLAGDVAYRWL